MKTETDQTKQNTMEVITAEKTIKKNLTLATVEVTINAIKLNNKAFTKTVFNQIPEDEICYEMWKEVKKTKDEKKYGDEVLNALEIQKVIAYCLEKKSGETIKWYLIIIPSGELMKCRHKRYLGNYRYVNVPHIYHFYKAKQVYYAV